MARQKVTPFLWFDNNAEEAATLYVSLFKNSRLGHIARYGEGGPGPAGQAMTVEFELDGVSFIALNGGPHFKLNEAFSMSIDCHDQAEVDDLWTKLIANGGAPSQCGWLKDRFGLSWQVVPAMLPKLLSDPDPEKSKRVMQAMMQMSKIDIAKLQQAADGR
jgi:predicted 3-demethylubiquinone-9 3-methyltransferase (glyoxalase superfamily)